MAIIAHVNKEKLIPIADRFRMLVEKSSITIDSNILSVTVSIGATIARPDDTLETLIKRVEELMYQSKATGHNCVTID